MSDGLGTTVPALTKSAIERLAKSWPERPVTLKSAPPKQVDPAKEAWVTCLEKQALRTAIADGLEWVRERLELPHVNYKNEDDLLAISWWESKYENVPWKNKRIHAKYRNRAFAQISIALWVILNSNSSSKRMPRPRPASELHPANLLLNSSSLAFEIDSDGVGFDMIDELFRVDNPDAKPLIDSLRSSLGRGVVPKGCAWILQVITDNVLDHLDRDYVAIGALILAQAESEHPQLIPAAAPWLKKSFEYEGLSDRVVNAYVLHSVALAGKERYLEVEKIFAILRSRQSEMTPSSRETFYIGDSAWRRRMATLYMNDPRYKARSLSDAFRIANYSLRRASEAVDLSRSVGGPLNPQIIRSNVRLVEAASMFIAAEMRAGRTSSHSQQSSLIDRVKVATESSREFLAHPDLDEPSVYDLARLEVMNDIELHLLGDSPDPTMQFGIMAKVRELELIKRLQK